MSTGYNFIDMLLGRPRPQQPNNSDGSFGVQDPMKLFSPLRKAGIAADSLVLRGYGTGQQLREQGLQEAQFAMAQNQRADTIKALRQRAATGDAVAEKVLMAVENRSLLPADAMKIYFREKFAKPDTTFTMKKGSELGMTGENADKYFNFGSDGSIKTIGGGGMNITNKLGETIETLMAKEGMEYTSNLYKKADTAASFKGTIDRQLAILDDPNFDAGTGSFLITGAKGLLQRFGLEGCRSI